MKRVKLFYILVIASVIAAIVLALFNIDFFEYQRCKYHHSLDGCISFLDVYPQSKYADKVKSILLNYDDDFYERYFSNVNMEDGVSAKEFHAMEQHAKEYEQYFPEGKRGNDIYEACEDASFSRLSGTYAGEQEFEYYFSRYPQGKHLFEAKKLYKKYTSNKEQIKKTLEKKKADKIAKEEKAAAQKQLQAERIAAAKAAQQEEYNKYKDNFLSNGSQPYAKYYGYNPLLDEYDDRAEIKVKAPSNSDVIVIVKRGGKTGPVMAHMYVRKGMTFSVNVKPRIAYQVFFYSGYGWDPEKQHGNVKGGFVGNESVVADEQQILENLVQYNYDLNLSVNGNLHLSNIDVDDAF